MGDEFLFLRNPDEDLFKLVEGSGLYLKLQNKALVEQTNASYIAIRQQHASFRASCMLDASQLNEGECAGLVLLQSNEYHLRVDAGKDIIKVILCRNGVDEILARHCVFKIDKKGMLTLYIHVNGIHAAVGTVCGDYQSMLAQTSIASLSTEVAGGFVGSTVGIYAYSKNIAAGRYARFKEFNYEKSLD